MDCALAWHMSTTCANRWPNSVGPTVLSPDGNGLVSKDGLPGENGTAEAAIVPERAIAAEAGALIRI